MDSLKNIFTVSELRNRILFTLGMLAVYRVGNHIPTPGVNSAALVELARLLQNTMFGLYDMFSGGNLSKVTIFALGIMPYISASIILQLLTVVWPYLERLSREGELGRRKITQYTRYGTILLSVIQSGGIAFFLERQTQVAGGLPLVYHPGLGFRLMTVLTLTTGTCFVMWLGEQITERGIGNGMSLIIFAGIVVGFPRAVLQTIDQIRTGQLGLFSMLILVVVMALVVAAIIFVERGHRRVTVQYAKRVVGRRMYGGSSTHIPLKVNTGGVIPVIFASSILAFPATIAQAFQGPWALAVSEQLGVGMPLYNLLYVIGIIFFAYFYTAIIFNPDDVAENMRKYGGFVPGIRPGKRTAEYIDTILTRITLVGAVYLALIAILPEFLITGFKVAPIPFIGEWLDSILPRFITEGMNVQFYFGGTSLLIIVGVAMDTVQQVESQLIMRHYDGFMKKTRIRGVGGAEPDGAEPRDDARPSGGRQRHAGGAVRAVRGFRRSRPATSCARPSLPAASSGCAPRPSWTAASWSATTLSSASSRSGSTGPTRPAGSCSTGFRVRWARRSRSIEIVDRGAGRSSSSTSSCRTLELVRRTGLMRMVCQECGTSYGVRCVLTGER